MTAKFIRCGRLLDGKSDQPHPDVVIAIEGEKIKAVGAAANVMKGGVVYRRP